MFLLNINSLSLEIFVDDSNIPPYYILSHTWGSDEVTYQDVRTSSPEKLAHRKGWQKIEGFCKMLLAVMEKSPSTLSLMESENMAWDYAVSTSSLPAAEYVWVDTCCINKESSAELSEAINSMYRWYAEAIACVVYLDDVDCESMLGSQVGSSRWFTRGWTLQELLAPRGVLFYSSNWHFLGEKSKYSGVIATITLIQSEYLTGDQSLWEASSAEKMSWAARRMTTRSEDIAYCLMGIFDINMPLLYGEGGTKAFIRLQEEILKDSTDESIFAWDASGLMELHGMLASHPRQFWNSSRTVPLGTRNNPQAIRNGDFMMHVSSLGIQQDHTQVRDVLLDCAPKGSSANVGIAVRVWKSHDRRAVCKRVAARPALVLAQRFSGHEQDLLFTKRSKPTLNEWRFGRCAVKWPEQHMELLEAWPGSCWQWDETAAAADGDQEFSMPRRGIKLDNMQRALDLARSAFPGRGNGRLVLAVAFATKLSKDRRDYFVLGIHINPASGGSDTNLTGIPAELLQTQSEPFRASPAWVYMCGQIEAWSSLREPFLGSMTTVNIGDSQISVGHSLQSMDRDKALEIWLRGFSSQDVVFPAPQLHEQQAFEIVGLQARKTEDDFPYWKSFFS